MKISHKISLHIHHNLMRYVYKHIPIKCNLKSNQYIVKQTCRYTLKNLKFQLEANILAQLPVTLIKGPPGIQFQKCSPEEKISI